MEKHQSTTRLLLLTLVTFDSLTSSRLPLEKKLCPTEGAVVTAVSLTQTGLAKGPTHWDGFGLVNKTYASQSIPLGLVMYGFTVWFFMSDHVQQMFFLSVKSGAQVETRTAMSKVGPVLIGRRRLAHPYYTKYTNRVTNGGSFFPHIFSTSMLHPRGNRAANLDLRSAAGVTLELPELVAVPGDVDVMGGTLHLGSRQNGPTDDPRGPSSELAALRRAQDMHCFKCAIEIRSHTIPSRSFKSAAGFYARAQK